MIYKVGPTGALMDPRAKRKDRRPSSSKRGYNSRWQAFRIRYLRAHPYCLVCGAKATQVDHIDGMGPHGPKGYAEDNLRPLCHSHHSQRTAADQPGGWGATP